MQFICINFIVVSFFLHDRLNCHFLHFFLLFPFFHFVQLINYQLFKLRFYSTINFYFHTSISHYTSPILSPLLRFPKFPLVPLCSAVLFLLYFTLPLKHPYLQMCIHLKNIDLSSVQTRCCPQKMLILTNKAFSIHLPIFFPPPLEAILERTHFCIFVKKNGAFSLIVFQEVENQKIIPSH